MSSSTKFFWSLRWLCLIAIVCIHTAPTQGTSKLCGEHLSQALDLICENGFATKTKKSIDPLDYGMDDYSADEGELPSGLAQLPFFSKIANNALAKTRRRRHGIYHECCEKQCSLSELRSYCL